MVVFGAGGGGAGCSTCSARPVENADILNSSSDSHWDSVPQGEARVNGSVDILCHAGHGITDMSDDCSKYPCTPNDLVPNGTETCVSPEKDLKICVVTFQIMFDLIIR